MVAEIVADIRTIMNGRHVWLLGGGTPDEEQLIPTSGTRYDKLKELLGYGESLNDHFITKAMEQLGYDIVYFEGGGSGIGGPTSESRKTAFVARASGRNFIFV